MKNRIVMLMISLFLGLSVQAQELNIFDQKEFVWLGLDFTGARMIGSVYFKDPKIIKDEFFDKWNRLMIDEANKYNFAEFYQIRTRYNDVLPAGNRNSKVDVNKLVTDDTSYELSKKDVAAICSAYKGNTQKQDGLGLLYVVESFDKLSNMANIYVVMLDLKTFRPVYIKKYQQPPGGAGMRNFWAGSVFRTMEISGNEFRDNKARYLKLRRM